MSSSSDQNSLLRVRGLSVRYPVKSSGRTESKGKQWLEAVEGVSFEIRRGEVLGVVGESGCGKSSMARALVGLAPVSDGTIEWEGESISANRQVTARLKRDIQFVFQDPYSSLNPRMTVGEVIAEPLIIHERSLSKKEISRRVDETLKRVGMGPEFAARFPHELSGGQCQRVSIARALVLGPKMLICDEAVSALDVSVQAQILDLFSSLRREFNLSILFISHDLSVVRHISDTVMVMYLGRVMETSSASKIFSSPLHPYTQALLSSVPQLEAQPGSLSAPLKGDVPSPVNKPSGCVFRTRCPIAREKCSLEKPQLEARAPGQFASCFFAGENPTSAVLSR